MRDIDPAKWDITVVSPRNHMVFTPLLASTCVGTVETRSVTLPIVDVQPAIKLPQVGGSRGAAGVQESGADGWISGWWGQGNRGALLSGTVAWPTAYHVGSCSEFAQSEVVTRVSPPVTALSYFPPLLCTAPTELLLRCRVHSCAPR